MQWLEGLVGRGRGREGEGEVSGKEMSGGSAGGR